VELYVKQEIQSEMIRWIPDKGTPQGAVLSPLLANIYLHPLDVEMAEGGRRMIRFADDFVILCRSEQEARQALVELYNWTQTNGLTLHPDKTRVGNCLEYGQGFEFLGYRFERGKRFVREKSRQKLRDKVRAKTPRNRGQSIKRIIQDLNPILRGWYNYFKHAHWRNLHEADGFVRRRLRSILSEHKKKSWKTHSKMASKRWPNTYFAEQGLFSMYEARVLECQSR
jgi:RNA-directed DNA polymerase